MQQAGPIIGPFAAGEVGLVGSCLPEMSHGAQQRWVILVSVRHGVLRCSPHLRTGERGGAAGKMLVNRGGSWRTHIAVGRVLEVATMSFLSVLLGPQKLPSLRVESGSG